MDAIGADYLVVNSSITLHMLKEQGFELVQSLDMALVPDEERRLLNLPIGHLILMRKPENDEGVIAPRTKWTRQGNTLTFEARRGLVYRVKYRHDKGFVAEQSGKRLPIEIYPGCDELNLPFMRIRAPEDGPIRLAFRDRLF
jgi:hypothetical protein